MFFGKAVQKLKNLLCYNVVVNRRRNVRIWKRCSIFLVSYLVQYNYKTQEVFFFIFYLKNNIEVSISDHAGHRLDERMGLCGEDVQGFMAWQALCYGKTTADCNGYLRDCMEHYVRSWHEAKGRELYYYKGMIYVFEGNCLVTVFPIQKEVQKATIKKQERRRVAKAARRYAAQDNYIS